MTELRKIEKKDRELAVKIIAANLENIQRLLKENVAMAKEYGVNFTFRDPNYGEHYYLPEKPEGVDVEGTDWKESYCEEDYDYNGELFGWKSSSSYC